MSAYLANLTDNFFVFEDRVDQSQVFLGRQKLIGNFFFRVGKLGGSSGGNFQLTQLFSKAQNYHF
jgi:hypothetical protein